MDTEQNWYRQLLALVLLSASRAAVEFVTNPNSREDATKQIRSTFAEIDYDSLANALTRVLDQAAVASKDRLTTAIDTLHDASVDQVEQAKDKAQKQLAPQKSGGGKFRFFLAVLIGGAIAYLLMDEQRRDQLLDRLTGASGPIQQSSQSTYNQPTNTTQGAANQTPGAAKDATQNV